MKEKDIKRLLELSGTCRGATLKADRDFVLQYYGKEALEQVVQKLQEWGVPLDYEEIKELGFYPLGWRALSLLAIKEALGLDDKTVEQIGSFSANTSLIVKLYFKFFHSISLVAKKAPKLWKEYYTQGSLKVVNLDETGKRVEIRIEDFVLHEVFCNMIKGYFKAVIKMATGSSDVSCKEQSCAFENNTKVHKFICTWK